MPTGPPLKHEKEDPVSDVTLHQRMLRQLLRPQSSPTSFVCAISPAVKLFSNFYHSKCHSLPMKQNMTINGSKGETMHFATCANLAFLTCTWGRDL